MKILRSKITLGILIIILGFLGGCFIVSRMLESKIKEEILNIEKRGEPVNISQVIPPLVSASENAAPLYSAAIELVDITRLNISSQRDYCLFYKNNQREVIETLENNKIVFQLLYQGFKRKKCRYDLNYTEGIVMRLPNFIKATNLLHLLILKAHHEIESKQLDDAAKTIAVALKFTRTFQPEYVVITSWFKNRFRGYMLNPLKKLADSGYKIKLPDLLEELNKVSEEIQKETLLAFYGERVMGVQLIDTFHDKYRHQLIATDTGLEGSFLFWLEVYLPGKPLLKYDKLYYIRLWEKVITDYQKGEKVSITSLEEIPKFCVLTLMLIPNSSELIDKIEKTKKEYQELRKI